MANYLIFLKHLRLTDAITDPQDTHVPIAITILMVNWKPTYFYHLWKILSKIKISSRTPQPLLISYLNFMESPDGKTLLIIKSISRRKNFISRIALKFQNVDIRTNDVRSESANKSISNLSRKIETATPRLNPNWRK
jgi:hypothetical protein